MPITDKGFYDEHMRFVVEPGNVDVLIGSSSQDIRLQGSFEIKGNTLDVMGKRAYFSRSKVDTL